MSELYSELKDVPKEEIPRVIRGELIKHVIVGKDSLAFEIDIDDYESLSTTMKDYISSHERLHKFHEDEDTLVIGLDMKGH